MERLPVQCPAVVPAFRPAGPSVWRRLIDALFAPRALRWNLASAMVVAERGGDGHRRDRDESGINADARRTEPEAPRGAGITPVSSAPSTTLVRLVIMQPGAKTVQVAGDFNGWNPARTSLEQISDGAWAVTIPLKPGRYAYMFVVDGKQWIADPFAAEQKDDGFGSRNAVLEVRPAETRPGASL